MWGGGVKKVYHGSTKVYGNDVEIPIYTIAQWATGSVNKYYKCLWKVGVVTDGYANSVFVSQYKGNYPSFTYATLTAFTGKIGGSGSTVTLDGSTTGTYIDTVIDGLGYKWCRYSYDGTFDIHVSPGQMVNDKIMKPGGGTITNNSLYNLDGKGVHSVSTGTQVGTYIYRY